MSQDLRTRRDALKILGAGAAAGWLAGAHAAPATTAGGAVRFFPLAAVRLGAGPFLDAQRRDADYLLRLEPDRMLHNFRLNAGLAPRAAVYGGWESQEPWVEIRCHGHTLGHYLGACACMFESTGDARFAERVDHIVTELAECQAKRGDGLLCAFPDGAAPLLDSLAGKPFAGVPWYTMHKVMAGLRDAHLHRGSDAALAVLRKLADWIDAAAAPSSDATLQKMLDREHGGMNEVFVDLFELTGDERYRRLSLRFSHRALLDPLSQSRDTLDGLHANTQIPKVIGFSRIHAATGEPAYGKAAEFFWQTVAAERSYATGGHGDGEHFFASSEFAQRLGSAKTMETCCTHNMLRLTRSLFERNPLAAYTDYFEKALFNGILASQDPDTGMMTYFQATRPGYVKLYHTPFDSFWCCTGSGMENHARYGESIYAHDGDTLLVNLFLSSTLDWRDRGVQLTQTTHFPDGDTTLLEISSAQPQPLSLAIRHPNWCAVMTITVNGRHRSVSRRPGSYYTLKRRFRAGDRVEVHLPMALHLAPLPHAPEHAAVMFGPIVLAARLGTQGVPAGSQLIVNERQSGQMLNEPVAIPVWSRPLDELTAVLARQPEPELKFTTRNFAGGGSVEFVPWFRIARERYNLYWHRSPTPG